MKQSINQGEIGLNTVPLTTKEFKRVVKKYFRAAKVKVYKFKTFNKVRMYIHVYFWGKLNVNIAEELKSYVPAGCDFLFLKKRWWEWFYSKEYGLFWLKKKKYSEEDCKRKRKKVVKEIEDENKERSKQEGEAVSKEPEA